MVSIKLYHKVYLVCKFVKLHEIIEFYLILCYSKIITEQFNIATCPVVNGSFQDAFKTAYLHLRNLNEFIFLLYKCKKSYWKAE